MRTADALAKGWRSAAGRGLRFGSSSAGQALGGAPWKTKSFNRGAKLREKQLKGYPQGAEAGDTCPYDLLRGFSLKLQGVTP